MPKKLIFLFFGAALLATGMSGEALAQEPMAAPARKIEKKLPERSPDLYPLGAMQDPFQPEGLKPGKRPALKRDLPPAFNWRDNATAGTTAVKNQGAHGTCWIFGSLASLEGAVKLNDSPSTDPDYSERDIGAGNAPGEWDGGHTKIAANHLSLYASILEADNPYSLGEPGPPRPVANYWNPPEGTPQMKVSKWHSLGDLDTLSDVDALKQAIYANGPVTTSMSVDTVEAWDASFGTGAWDSSRVVPYLPTSNITDHCVCVVGWDDDKVHDGGGGTGAWLVKNSWGTSWGSTEGGYFWIAYGSARMGATSAFFPQDGYETYDSDEESLYYDEFGQWRQLGWNSIYTVYCINAFTPSFTGDRFLNKVAFWAVWPELDYEITVWDTWDRSAAPSDQLGSTVSGSLVDAGFFTVELPSPVSLTSGNEIFIQVKITNPNDDYYYLVPYEYKISWFTNDVVKESGKSYASYSQNTGWMDISSSYGDLAVRGVMTSSIPPTVTPTETPTSTSTPTATETEVPPTETFTETPTPTPTETEVPPTETFTETPTPTATETEVAPTETFTETPTPTATETEVAPTETSTETPTPTATNTPASTPLVDFNTGLIGAGGGTLLAGPDGFYTLPSINIPAGALVADITFEIFEPSETDRHGIRAAVQYAPSGTAFSASAEITLEFRADDIPGGYTENDMRIFRWSNTLSNWEEIDDTQTLQQINATTWTLTADIDHLSIYGILAADSRIDVWRVY
jgi:C1A family cysteine protease/outer membrane biosynthesis protein TonB